MDLSPDGRRIAADIDGRAWIYNIENGNLTPLSVVEPQGAFPSWNRDSSTIVAVAGHSRLYTALVDDGASPAVLWESVLQIWGPRWSPDGEFIVGIRLTAQSGPDLWRVSVDNRQESSYLQDPGAQDWPVFSPRGHWVAYASDETGEFRVYARRFPDASGRRVDISAGPGTKPLWFDGELFYRRGEQVVAVKIEETPADLNVLGRRELPFRLRDEAENNLLGYDYDYDPAHDRFLVVRPVVEDQSPRIHVVLNWFEELKRRSGAR